MCSSSLNQMWWVKALNANQLRAAMTKRIKSVMSVRRQGDRMGRGEREPAVRLFQGQVRVRRVGAFYWKAHGMDGGAPMSMNNFNTLEQHGEPNGLPSKYIHNLWQIKGAFPTMVTATGQG